MATLATDDINTEPEMSEKIKIIITVKGEDDDVEKCHMLTPMSEKNHEVRWGTFEKNENEDYIDIPTPEKIFIFVYILYIEDKYLW